MNSYKTIVAIILLSWAAYGGLIFTATLWPSKVMVIICFFGIIVPIVLTAWLDIEADDLYYNRTHPH